MIGDGIQQGVVHTALEPVVIVEKNLQMGFMQDMLVRHAIRMRENYIIFVMRLKCGTTRQGLLTVAQQEKHARLAMGIKLYQLANNVHTDILQLTGVADMAIIIVQTIIHRSNIIFFRYNK